MNKEVYDFCVKHNIEILNFNNSVVMGEPIVYKFCIYIAGTPVKFQLHKNDCLSIDIFVKQLLLTIFDEGTIKGKLIGETDFKNKVKELFT